MFSCPSPAYAKHICKTEGSRAACVLPWRSLCQRKPAETLLLNARVVMKPHASCIAFASQMLHAFLSLLKCFMRSFALQTLHALLSLLKCFMLPFQSSNASCVPFALQTLHALLSLFKRFMCSFRSSNASCVPFALQTLHASLSLFKRFMRPFRSSNASCVAFALQTCAHALKKNSPLRSRPLPLPSSSIRPFRPSLLPPHNYLGHQNACALKNRRKRVRQKIKKGRSWCGCSKQLLNSFTAA